MAKVMVKLDGISKQYGETMALSSLSFQVHQGEKIAVIGPSGAGKTTLLNILARIVEPDEGRLEIDGQPAYRYTSRQFAHKVGVIRQQFDLVGSLPVIHNVLAGRLKDWGFFKSCLSFLWPQERHLAVEALARVGLEDKVYEKTAHLSGGEQQRVALSRLLVQRPELILADEPVSALDPARAHDILAMLVKLVEEERQTLIATLHTVEYARTYFERIIALREGRLYFDLPASEVTDEQLNQLYHLTELNQYVAAP